MSCSRSPDLERKTNNSIKILQKNFKFFHFCQIFARLGHLLYFAPPHNSISEFISNPSSSTRSDKIHEFLSRFGDLKDFQLIYSSNRRRARHTGRCFIKFRELKATKYALKNTKKFKLDNSKIHFKKANIDPKNASRLDKRALSHRLSCWFCLSNPSADKSLVVFQTPHFYIALDKGPIEDFHVLVVPQAHIPTSLSFTDAEKSNLRQIEQILKKFFRGEQRSVLKVERHFNFDALKSHLIMNYVSFPQANFDTVKSGFELFCKRTKFKFLQLDGGEGLWDVMDDSKDDQFYLLAEFWDSLGKIDFRYFSELSRNFVSNLPPNFTREFICQILELDDRANWVKCVRKEGCQKTEFLKKRLGNVFGEVAGELRGTWKEGDPIGRDGGAGVAK